MYFPFTVKRGFGLLFRIRLGKCSCSPSLSVLGLQVHAVLPREGLLSQQSQILYVCVLMRISPTPGYLRIICNRHPKRNRLPSLIFFSCWACFVTVADSLFLPYAYLPTYTTTECYTNITHPIHSMLRPSLTSTQPLPDIEPLLPAPKAPAPKAPNLLQTRSPPFGSALPKRRLISHRAQKFEGGSL